MSVKIRLTRKGKKHQPSYRIVAIDSKKPRDGAALEILGYYNPSHPQQPFEINQERYKYWLSVGAEPTDAVKKLIEGTYQFSPYKPTTTPKEEEAAKPAPEKEAAESGETPDTKPDINAKDKKDKPEEEGRGEDAQ